MLRSAHCRVAVDAGGIRSKSYEAHVVWDGSVVSTTKPGEVDPVFARKVLFAWGVNGGRADSEEGVWGESVLCALM